MHRWRKNPHLMSVPKVSSRVSCCGIKISPESEVINEVLNTLLSVTASKTHRTQLFKCVRNSLYHTGYRISHGTTSVIRMLFLRSFIAWEEMLVDYLTKLIRVTWPGVYKTGASSKEIEFPLGVMLVAILACCSEPSATYGVWYRILCWRRSAPKQTKHGKGLGRQDWERMWDQVVGS